ncbi:MAG: XTP/dITP diphosphatase [Peptococcaceae bacterium]|nr:XTP/dITP diphosphatase [Peptococcaceae bacterium]
MQILLATTNQGKVQELVHLLSPAAFTIKSLADFPQIGEIEETGTTFRENALIKARAACQETGLLTLADDSGLEVDALNGQPGVHSARYAGEPKDDSRNNAKLLAALQEIPTESRGARFKSVIAIVTPQGEEFTAEGVCEGAIGLEPKGTGGFGYDPLFYVSAYAKTFAELNLAQKNTVSHRGKALRAAADILDQLQQKG